MGSLFLFGAGASFGSGPCAPSAPPLGSQFFAALHAQGGVARRVTNELASLFARDFEAGMDRFWQEHNTHTSELLRDMARFFAPFEPLEGNLYLELIKILGGTRKKAVFATTNYDLLIEHAIVKSGLLVSYSGFPVSDKNVPVLKIHGSCNFLPDLAPGQIQGISFDLSSAPSGSIIGAGVRIATSAQQVLDFCNREDSIAPALAMYHPSKRVLYCRDFVEAQQNAFHDSIKNAARIYLIGIRVHTVDEHIWTPLAHSSAPLYYIGGEPDEFHNWASTFRRRNAYVLSNSFAEGLRYIAAHHGL